MWTIMLFTFMKKRLDSDSIHRSSSIRGQGRGLSAHFALDQITLLINVPCCHSSNPHHHHKYPGLDQLDHASPVLLNNHIHCSIFVCPPEAPGLGNKYLATSQGYLGSPLLYDGVGMWHICVL